MQSIPTLAFEVPMLTATNFRAEDDVPRESVGTFFGGWPEYCWQTTKINTGMRIDQSAKGSVRESGLWIGIEVSLGIHPMWNPSIESVPITAMDTLDNDKFV